MNQSLPKKLETSFTLTLTPNVLLSIYENVTEPLPTETIEIFYIRVLNTNLCFYLKLDMK
jgi:hypothetical protein